MEDAQMFAGLTAYTAPGQVFATDEELKAHYKTDWHRHNLKRKVANLKPLTSEAFALRTQAAAESAAAANSGKRTGQARAAGPSASDANNGTDEGKRAHPQSKAAFYQRAAEMTDDEIIAARLAALPEGGLSPGVDVFSTHVSESLEANIAHMAATHSFVLPYAEYVVDLPGLIRYLQEEEVEPDEEESAAIDAGEVYVHVVYRPAAVAPVGGSTAMKHQEVETALIVKGGRELGHRSLRRYYGQSYAAEKPEQAQVQRLLQAYQQMGIIRAGPLLLGGSGAGGCGGNPSRHDFTVQQRQSLKLGVKSNILMRKRGQPSQNIIFG
ncbi:hypothetical protein T492DRAFT_1040274 [Pavlovales sp. CCMP2436]|nr:hypothetical protein T492DRAFT_1040274 [Pavlovales sp. CCMP2436]